MRRWFLKIPWYWQVIALLLLFHSAVQVGLLSGVTQTYSESVSLDQSFAENMSTLVVDGYIYLLIAAILQLAVLAFVAMILVPLIFTWSLRAYLEVIGRFVEFNVVLLLWGIVGNLCWVAVARHKLYYTPDPFVEWFPFIPYSSSIDERTWGDYGGHLIGSATDEQLRLIWGVLAIAVWLGSWASLRLLHSQTRAPQEVEA